MQAVFVSIDRNEDGAICRNELRAALVASSIPTTPDHEVTLDAMRRTRSKIAVVLRQRGPWPWPSPRCWPLSLALRPRLRLRLGPRLRLRLRLRD